MDWDPWRAALVTAGAVLVAAVAVAVVHVVLRRMARRDPLAGMLSGRARYPFRMLIVIVALLLARPEEGADPQAVERFRHGLTLLLIATGAWLFARLALVAQEAALRRYDLSIPDNLRVRRLYTQVIIVRRVAVAVVFVAAFAAMLLTFDSVRALGASLLASAGIIGAIAGFAAQATLANVIAGLQLAFSDEIRIDDVVVIDGEWGWIEELTLTYVVVHLWDERRLVLPTTYFTQKPFENWTRHEARVLGTVVLHVDYHLPVEPVREELRRILADSPLWDGRDWVLQVVDATPTTMVLRALMSSADAPSSWDLRCDVRERLLAFLARDYPEQLPRVRAEVGPEPSPAPDGRPGTPLPEPRRPPELPDPGRPRRDDDRRGSDAQHDRRPRDDDHGEKFPKRQPR